MTARYFMIEKSGPMSKLRRALDDGKLDGNSRMVRAYNWHGHDAGRVVQIRCHREVEAAFLRLMRRANIPQMEANVDPIAVLPDNPAIGPDHDRLGMVHLETIAAQWRRCEDAAKFEPTRSHFTYMIPTVTQHIQERRRESEGRAERDSKLRNLATMDDTGQGTNNGTMMETADRRDRIATSRKENGQTRGLRIDRKQTSRTTEGT